MILELREAKDQWGNIQVVCLDPDVSTTVAVPMEAYSYRGSVEGRRDPFREWLPRASEPQRKTSSSPGPGVPGLSVLQEARPA